MTAFAAPKGGRLNIASMPRFGHIMVATDLDDDSALTMQYARVLAERFHSRTTVLYADQLLYPLDYCDDLPPLAEPDRSGDERAVRDYARQWLPSLPVDLAMVPGHPASMILRAVRDHDPDLLILGTVGRHHGRRFSGMPVAENVIRHADRPVLVVPSHRVVAPPRQTPGVTRIVCPVNFTDVAREALELATALTEAFLAELTVVRVVEEESTVSDESLRRQLKHWTAPTLSDRCVYRHVLVRGGAAEGIIGAVEDFGGDLLVVGAQQTRFRGESVVGTTTERLIRLSRFPMLTVVRQPVEREEQRQAVAAPALAPV